MTDANHLISEIVRNGLNFLRQGGWQPHQIAYDDSFGDDRMCQCGHPYYRHWDWADDYCPMCKYCDCEVFKESTNDH